MENQHRKIIGYRELNQLEIDMMNEIKNMGGRLDELVENVNYMNRSAADETMKQQVESSQAFRWAAEAKTDLQKGLMSLTRAVAKPDFF